MGDRANVIVKTSKTEQVVFYTHWGGHRLPKDIQTALAKKWRWTDPSYLARIIFDEISHEPKTETGIGISGSIQDNEHEILIVNVPRRRVELYKPSFEQPIAEELLHSWTFEAFITIKDISFENMRSLK